MSHDPKKTGGGIPMGKWFALQSVIQDPRLPVRAIPVFGRLLDHHNSKNGLCYPSEKTLASALGCCERSVRTSIKALAEYGYIKVLRGQGPKRCNVYHINLPTSRKEYAEAVKSCQKFRKKSSAKPSHEPSKKPAAIPKPGSEPNWKKQPELSTAKMRERIEQILFDKLGGQEEAWEKMQEIDERIAEEVGALHVGDDASLEQAAINVLLKTYWSEKYGD